MKYAGRVVLSLALVAAVFQQPTASADDAESYFIRHTVNRYFPIHMTARTMGMGGAFVAVKGDSASILGNPAGLGPLTEKFMTGGFQFGQISGDDLSTLDGVDEDNYTGLLMGAYPITDSFSLGWGFVPTIAESDDSANRDTENYYVPISLAYQVNDAFSLGYGIGYINDDVSADGYDASMDVAFLHRFGVLFTASDVLDLGLMGTYGHGDADSSAVSGVKFDGDREAWGVQGGLAYMATPDLLLALDLAYEDMDTDGSVSNSLIPGFPSFGFEESIETMAVRAGAEYAWNECLKLRGGAGYTDYDYDTNDAATSALVDGLDGAHVSGGFGYDWNDNVTTDLAGMVRFFDEIDFVVGAQLTYKF
ncbi:hypothetical protein K8I31_18895 [bacterium]|nr:hypothetical protein [bacterium]